MQVVMDKYILIVLQLLVFLIFNTTSQSLHDDHREVKTLSRRRRYIVFPEGSTFSIAFCITWSMLIEPSIFTNAMNWALSYDLPNETIRYTDTNRLVPAHTLIRRQRRELYRSLEVTMDSAGIDGRTCIKRALCEAAQRLRPRASVAEEIVRVLFSFPFEKVDSLEPLEHHIYDMAHRRGFSSRNCEDLYKHCPFSLLDVFLGSSYY